MDITVSVHSFFQVLNFVPENFKLGSFTRRSERKVLLALHFPEGVGSESELQGDGQTLMSWQGLVKSHRTHLSGRKG